MASPSPAPALTTTDGLRTDSGHSDQYEASQHEDSPEYGDEHSSSNDVGDDPPVRPQPLQKRRRVTRACDECRRKKIKCDGKQPCTHCTVYSYECTYDQPSNRRRNATPQYIEALESQLKRAKALLHVVFPTVDLNDSSMDDHLQNGLLPQLPSAAPQPTVLFNESRVAQPQGLPHVEDGSDSHLEAMVKATGQLDLDEEGYVEYHGHSSGLSFMRGLSQFGDLFQIPPDRSPSLRHRTMSQDPPSPRSQLPSRTATAFIPGKDLPNKGKARMLCDTAIIDAGAMLRVVHLPTFYEQLERIYNTPFESYGQSENSFLPLLYAVLALGKLFSRSDEDLDKISYEELTDEGYKYFKASRQLLDIAECRDLTSLQAIVFMIQFLQSSAKLNTCYAYIGVALRSALRMGLHRSFNGDFTLIEAETRKRLFWVIRRMDTYVGAMLGLPRFLEDDDIDQEWPLEVDDEYITATEVLPMPVGSISVMAAFNAHTRIVQVLNNICKHVYPIKGSHAGGNNSVSYTVSYSKIRELERNLAQWLDGLPMALRHGGEAPPIIIRVQQLLRMAFGHAQLLLYRPFLHYVSSSNKEKNVDQRAFACASACVSVSRNIIHISSEMRKRGLLAGAYWFTMYTTFFAVVSILYFVTENPTNPTSFELLRDAVEGKEALAYFAKRSMAADRCSSALKTMFERLPESIRHGGELIESKKRRQASSPELLGSRSDALKLDDVLGLRRASTFPESIPDPKGTSFGHSLPISSTHLANIGLGPAYSSQSPSSRSFFDPLPGLTPSSTTAIPGGLSAPSIHGAQPNSTFSATTLGGSFAESSGLIVPISDISTMMFPSTDPLAYPNQPMTTFESKYSQVYDRSTNSQITSADMKSHPIMFGPPSMPPGGLGRRLNDSEAQLFGNMPMYLMQSAPSFREFAPPNGSPHMQMPIPNMQFDDLLNHDEWAQNFLDPALGVSNAKPPLASDPQYQQGTGVNGWR